jgi:hypothetical protein
MYFLYKYREMHSTCSNNGSLIIAGERNNDIIHTYIHVQIYNQIYTHKYFYIHLYEFREMHSTCTSNGSLIIAGGRDDEGQIKKDIWILEYNNTDNNININDEDEKISSYSNENEVETISTPVMSGIQELNLLAKTQKWQKNGEN